MTMVDDLNNIFAAIPFSVPNALVGVERKAGIRLVQKRFKLPGLMAELLYELLVDELKSNEELAEVGIAHPQLSIQRLRKMMNVTIHARRFTGYWLDPADRVRLVQEMDA